MESGTHSNIVSLPRALSKSGFCSRTKAEGLISEGRVAVNGRIVRASSLRVDLKKDRITVDGAGLHEKKKSYIMMNKPAGYVTTASDERGRKTVYDLLPGMDRWVSPVGRLDKESEGLLLFTNDTAWSSAVLDPKTGLDKVYHVRIDRIPDEAFLEAMKKGEKFPDGLLRVKSVSLLRTGEKNSWLEVTLDEGRNRQIRRLLEKLGSGILRLVRVSIGPLSLGTLAKGGSRELTAAEVEAVSRAVSGR